MESHPRPGSGGFSRHQIAAATAAAKPGASSAAAGAATPAAASTAVPNRSSYAPVVRPTLMDRMGGGMAPAASSFASASSAKSASASPRAAAAASSSSSAFERHPPPNLSASPPAAPGSHSSSGLGHGGSPFIFNATAAAPSYLSGVHASAAATATAAPHTSRSAAVAATATRGTSSSPPSMLLAQHSHSHSHSQSSPSPTDWYTQQPYQSDTSTKQHPQPHPASHLGGAARNPVKMPRDQLPPSSKSTSSSLASPPAPGMGGIQKLVSGQPAAAAAPAASPVATVRPDDDLHAIERRMLEDIGYFREGGTGSSRNRPSVTVESLLRDKRETDRLRARDEKIVHTLLPSPILSSSSSPSHPQPSPSPPSDMSLITSLTSRLSSLEKIAAKQAKTIGARDASIADLHMQLRADRAVTSSVEEKDGAPSSSSSSSSSASAELLYSLQQENEQYRRQVGEMETFLNDYGLVWVGFRAGAGTNGNAAASAASEDGVATPDGGTGTATASPAAGSLHSKSANANADIFFDVPSFLACVAELNTVANEGSGAALRIHTSASGVTKFLPPLSLDLVLYRDGMWFRGGPLRRWGSGAAREFVRDVMEGFFPSELKAEYPEGVAIGVVDKSKERCLQQPQGQQSGPGGASPTAGDASSTGKDGSSFQAFAGRGNRLEDGKLVDGSPTAAAAAAGALSASPTFLRSPSPPPQLSSAAPPHIGVHSFLEKLPTAVVRNGRVIDVREGVKAMLMPQQQQQQSGGGAAAASAATTAAAAAGCNASPSPSPPAPSGSGSSSIVVDTPALRLIQARETALAALQSSSAPVATPRTRRQALESLPPLPAMATLQVKMDPSDRCAAPLLLKLLASDSLADLRRLVDQHRAPGAPAYDLRSTYPARVYGEADGRASMAELGLTPNANLFVRNRRPTSAYRERPAQTEPPKPDESWSTLEEPQEEA